MKNPTGVCLCGCGKTTARSRESRRGYKRGDPMMFVLGHQSRSGLAWGYRDRGYETHCWIWEGSLSSHGYGRVQRDGVWYMAHRYMYEQRVGRIPAGHDLHHLCGQKACVNPEHLLSVARREHMILEGRRAYGRYAVRDAESAVPQ
jgi:hypothetical protein